MSELHWLDGADLTIHHHPPHGGYIREIISVAAWQHDRLDGGDGKDLIIRLFDKDGKYLISILGWEEDEGLND